MHKISSLLPERSNFLRVVKLPISSGTILIKFPSKNSSSKLGNKQIDIGNSEILLLDSHKRLNVFTSRIESGILEISVPDSCIEISCLLATSISIVGF